MKVLDRSPAQRQPQKWAIMWEDFGGAAGEASHMVEVHRSWLARRRIEATGGKMARDYDSQLLESVAVRRRRLRDALLFGAQRGRRTADERLGKVFAGIAITAVLCAGCVGWSFLQHTLATQKAEQEKQQRQMQQYGQPTR